ncbi:hypothetical protein K3495_g3681 [Podosphaera aphanis]|nr:hypothetical protein K3495_g3681 [Podosphaera aphanis]
MTTAKHPKSILKKSTHSVAASRADRNREIAVYHANIIQQRKNFELEILFSTETLIDYPLAPSPYDASNPSPVDSGNFKKLIQAFQPSDYDALILERNINDRCGYALCPNTRKKECTGTYRLIGTNGKAKDFRIVESKNRDKWCSDICAKRALYIRVQLSEIPIWERLATEENLQIDLLSEPKEQEIFESMADMKIESNEGSSETCTTPCSPPKLNSKGDDIPKKATLCITVNEKNSIEPARAPSMRSGMNENSHLELEGYTTGDNIELLMSHKE